MTSVDKFMEVFDKLINSAFDRIAKQNGVMCLTVVTIASYNASNKTAKVIFPFPLTTPDGVTHAPVPSAYNYPNQSGYALVAGQKAYLLHKYRKVQEGWIVNNLPIVL